MLSNSGRNAPDVKTTKSIGGFAYTNLFVISGIIRDLETYYQVASPLPLIADLPHGQLTINQTVFIASTSTLDNAIGIGARVVLISGLGEFGDMAEEVVILDGQTPVETNTIFSKVFETTIIQYGTNVDVDTGDSIQVGDIYVGTGIFVGGIPANPITGIAQIENNPNSRDGIFVVPANKLLLIKSIMAGTEPDVIQNTSLIVQIGLKLFGLGENVWFKTEPYTFDGTFQYLPEFNLPLPPLTEVQIRVKTTLAKSKSSVITLEVELKDLR